MEIWMKIPVLYKNGEFENDVCKMEAILILSQRVNLRPHKIYGMIAWPYNF